MSARLFPEDVTFVQRILSLEGDYEGAIDGIWGPLTERAAQRFEARSEALVDASGAFDHRSETAIRTLLSDAQRAARESLGRLWLSGWNARIISGTRSYTEQNRLYRQGRYGNPGAIVTKARGGRSHHNFGIAWDIGLFEDDGSYITSAGPYRDAAINAMAPHLEWGGDWPSFPDAPHYHLAVNEPIGTIRDLFERGIAFV